ncbi:MAG: L-rhamnose mutarotase [Acidobacteriaceae bacterium]
MKASSFAFLASAAAASLIVLGRSRSPRRRVGMVIGVRPDRLSAYEALHVASNHGVRDLLSKYHMHNFSIYLQKLEDGRYYLFGYYEYTGSDFAGDMARLSAEPRNQEWLRSTDPMQIPLPGEASWSTMREVYYNA